MAVSGRNIVLVAVSNGTVKTLNGATWHTPTNGTSALSSSVNVVRSAVNVGKLWFADGTSQKYYDPATDTVTAWTASAGSLPVDSSSNKPRLIVTWRGRTVQSGLLLDPQNYFMSAQSNPRDYDYGATFSPTMAVAGNNGPLGYIPDMITTMIPYTDDVLIFGGDHTIWMMKGDPLNGGSVNLVSDIIGMAFGIPWCKDPYGTVYFFSNRGNIYSLVPGQAPQHISQSITNQLNRINTGTNIVRLVWDDRFQGLHVFVTLYANSAQTTHFFWEWRTGAWWNDDFGNINHSPLCTLVYDGDDPNDRVSLIGSWDGYVRYLEPASTDDDGTDVTSQVALGPFLTNELDEMLLKHLQAVLSQASGSVTFSVHVGATAELALNSVAVKSGTWTAGRNLTEYIQRADHAVWIKITSTSPWAMESIRALVETEGVVRMRGV